MHPTRELVCALPTVHSVSESVAAFREIYGLFTPDEWLDNTERTLMVFEAIARYRPDLIGVGIRLNVQINLVLRTYREYVGEDQPTLSEVWGRGQIGCFALTESKAGVLSGMQVDIQFREVTDYLLICETQDIRKEYISQATVADSVLLFASNVDNPRDVRVLMVPQSKLSIEPRHDWVRQTIPGLDLGTISFPHDVPLHHSTILTRTTPASRMDILRGIVHGRICIARSVLAALLGMVDHCERWINGLSALSECIYRIREDAEMLLTQVRRATRDSTNVERVSAAKVRAVESAMVWYQELAYHFTTHALAYPLRFEHLVVNKVAEGDTTVLRLFLLARTKRQGILAMLRRLGVARTMYCLFGERAVYKHPQYITEPLVDYWLQDR